MFFAEVVKTKVAKPDIRNSSGYSISASGLAFGKTATIKSSGKDRYGRTLGYIFIEDQAINTMMVRMGMAWWYRRYDKTEELENAERYAKENKIGLWADPNPIAPWDWRKGKR